MNAPARRAPLLGGSPTALARNAFGDRQQRRVDQQIVVGVGLGLTALVVLALRLGAGSFSDADGWDALGGDFTFGAGDALGALLWGTSLYFCSPLQLLLLFFGFFEDNRPSDWLLRVLGTAAGRDVDAIDYSVPAGVQVAAVAAFGVCGVALAAGLEALLGDATWSVSTGLGACMFAGMYEVGRPRRLSVEEAQTLKGQWQDFKRFADARLQRGGRCHESEILRALGRELPRYRAERQLDSNTLRDLVRNWHRDADRTSNGYYKGISLAQAGGTGTGSSGGSGGGVGPLLRYTVHLSLVAT
ncbi:hypothetical protein C2E20_7018 [Micractinium conductrix]|uniref:Uncharacterized protein n=1 Tax=Micractinium conductrix TaxID=554055 RepID=A0A2P6V5Y4_9CHLO|nr:hypothetical protein C2E20_7018 [Micractinium conductrix]|eukprot:PSC69498.1 hypothetical protein C2E20_7018 [Micractinium conductrix]